MEHSKNYFEFWKSRLEFKRTIKESPKIKIDLVYSDALETGCILRRCKNRDLSSMCESLKKVKDPNTIVVYDYVYYGGDTYILEEYIIGDTVGEVLEKKKFSEKETAEIIIEVCKSLQVLHSQTPPIIHNDISPSNIMIREDGSIKLFDFDISRLYDEEKSQNTQLFGTAGYAAPEHYGFGQSGPRTDIYSLGATMHKMLTGRELSKEHKMTYSGPLKNILAKCLEHDPKNRYSSVSELRKDLEKFSSSKKGCWSIFLVLATIIVGVLFLLSKIDVAFDHESVNGVTQMQDSTSVSETVFTTDTGTYITTEGSDATTEIVEQTTTTELVNQTNTSESTGANAQQNHSRETAKEIDFDQVYEDAVLEGGVDNWYKFVTGSEMAVYRIYIQFDEGPYCPKLGLYDSDGIKIEELEIYTNREKEGFLDLYLDLMSEYSIKVISSDKAKYTLSLSARGCDAGTDKDDALELTLGERYTAIVDSTLSDWYYFVVPEDGSYRITLHNVDAGAPVKCYYWNESRPVILNEVENEDSGSNSKNFNSGETIYVEVKSTKKEADGTYILLVEKE